MDGPSTNWNVIDLINDHQVAIRFQKTLDIGSCSLHILHGAFQTPKVFPMKFCSTRWIEDQPVTD